MNAPVEVLPGAGATTWGERNQQWLVARFAELRERIETHASGAAVQATESVADESFTPALDRVTQIFGLSPFERELLLLAAGVELDAALRRAVASAQSLHSGVGGPVRPCVSLALSVLRHPHWDALSPQGALRYWRLVEIDPVAPLSDAGLRVDDHLLHVITGVAGLDPRLTGVARLMSASVDPGAADPLASRIARVLEEPDDRPVLVMVSPQSEDGADYRAAADLALAALSHLCLHALWVNALDLSADPRERADTARLLDRQAALTAAALVVPLEPLEGHHAHEVEQRIAGLVMHVRCPVVLIGALSRGTLAHVPGHRRVVRFGASAGPVSTLAALRPGTPLAAAVRRATHQFRLGASALEQALHQLGSDRDSPSSLDEAVWDAFREAARGGLDTLGQRITSGTTFDDVVLPRAQLSQLRDITRQLRHRHRVYEEWRFGAVNARGLGLCALFAGESGTGKTIAAEAIANEARLDLYRIDLATVVSKYIGETEKNLRRLFDAAEASGAVLLFDEADALFGKRSEIKDSHDRYANIEIAYLLQRIEAYRGLAILTTNMKSALDRAFLRRIRVVVHFPFPDEKAREEIWRRQFPREAPVDGLDFAALARLQLAGGNIRAIAINAAFKAADVTGVIDQRLVMDAARAEFSKLERQMTGRDGGVTS